MAKGSKLAGALTRGPREKVGERLSPGVYRGDKGGLVNRSGAVMQRPQNPQPQMPPPEAFNNLPGYRGMEGIQNGMLQVPGGRPLPADIGNMIGGQPIQDYMYRYPTMPQMPQPSANMGGQYRLSPGVYGTQQQAMNQYNQQMQQMQQPFQMQGVPQQSKR